MPMISGLDTSLNLSRADRRATSVIIEVLEDRPDCLERYPFLATEISPPQALVDTRRMVVTVSILSRQPPHLMPQVDRVGLRARRLFTVGVEKRAPFVVSNRAKDTVRFYIRPHRESLDGFVHERRPCLTPYEFRGIFHLTDGPHVRHQLASN